MFFKHLRNTLKTRRRIYLDVASSTPLDHSFIKRMKPIPHAVRGANPHALHVEGVRARQVIEDARGIVASSLGAHSDEIIFTSGATESDNLALMGVINRVLAQGVPPESITVMTSVLEHAAVSEAIAQYAAQGMGIAHIPADNGSIDPKAIIVPQGCAVLLVSVMYVNNEIGTVQPIRDIAKRIRFLRKHNPSVEIIFHTDATQAPAHRALSVRTLGVDLMTLGATKLYTHKGVGVLYKKRQVAIVPIMHGGGQEFGLRPGTEPIELIHAFAYALQYTDTLRESETIRIKALQEYFEKQLSRHVPEAVITASGMDRAPHISHIAIKGFDSELLVIELDARGIAVSAKSACKNEDDRESEVVEQIYGRGYGAVRFSFGRMTRKSDIDRAVQALRAVVAKYCS